MQPEPRVELTLMPELTLIGYAVRIGGGTEGGDEAIPRFWKQFLTQGLRERLPDSVIPGLLLGACWNEQADTSFEYMIGIPARTEVPAGPGQMRLDLPATRFARVTVRGEMSLVIPQGFRWFHERWLPESGMVLAAGPHLEWYDHRTCEGPESEVDLLIPVA